MKLSIRLFALLLPLTLLCTARADFSAMSFADAASGFTAEKYDLNGHVGRDGAVKRGGLGCSGYVSVVLQRMQNGKDWLKQYDLHLHEKHGEDIAKEVGLTLTYTLPSAKVGDAAEVKKLIKAGTLAAEALYMFNVDNGHVGFVRVKADGALVQSHYSGMKAYNGLATGDFAAWHKASMYKSKPVQFYLLSGAK